MNLSPPRHIEARPHGRPAQLIWSRQPSALDAESFPFNRTGEASLQSSQHRS